MLRTFAVGEPPTQLYRDLHDTADAAFDAMAAVIRHGAKPADVVAASGIIEERGFTTIDDILHGYGGGYLSPILSSRSRIDGAHPVPDEPFETDMVLVIQPNVVTTGQARRRADRRDGARHRDGHRAHARAGAWYPADPSLRSSDMPIATTGSNTTGTRGLVAVDKVGNRIRFYDPASLQETKALDQPEPCVHELAIAPDRSRAFMPLYGDGIYGNNKSPNNKVVVVDLARQAIADIIDLGPCVAPHGMVATSDGKLWVVCDIPNKLLLVDPARRVVEAAYDCPSKGSHILVALPDEQPALRVGEGRRPIAAFDIAAARVRRSDPGRSGRRDERQRLRHRGHHADAGRPPPARHRQRPQRPARDRHRLPTARSTACRSSARRSPTPSARGCPRSCSRPTAGISSSPATPAATSG